MAKRIMVCDADSGGKTGPLLVADGMTVSQYFSQYKPGKSMANYRVSVNEQPASGGTELTEECRLNISPAKFGGADAPLFFVGGWDSVEAITKSIHANMDEVAETIRREDRA